MRDHNKLRAFKLADDVAVMVYRVTREFPREELYGLTSQMRRAAVSVPSNIVEGQSRNTTKEYLHFLHNARGSLEEVRYFLLLSFDLKFLKENKYKELEQKYESASKMLNGLIKSIKLKLK